MVGWVPTLPARRIGGGGWWFVLAGCRCLVWCVVCVFAGGVPGVFAVGEFDAMFMRVFPSCTTKE